MEAVREVMKSARRSDIDLTPPPQEEEILKLYSERLVRKLEQKMLQLEKEIKMRQEAEEIFRQSEAKHRTLLQNLPHKIFTKDINSVYVSCN